MRYKVGDTVRIREDIEIDKVYDGLTFWDSMYEDLYGKDLVIDEVEEWCYSICGYTITESMLVPKLKYPIIAVDLDHTIISSDNNYPYVDEVNQEAISVLMRYKDIGGKIILWTLRTDDHLNLALEALHDNGLKWDAVNENLKESIEEWDAKYPNMSYSPKICCDLFIDDKAYPANIIGINWKILEKELCRYEDNIS